MSLRLIISSFLITMSLSNLSGQIQELLKCYEKSIEAAEKHKKNGNYVEGLYALYELGCPTLYSGDLKKKDKEKLDEKKIKTESLAEKLKDILLDERRSRKNNLKNAQNKIKDLQVRRQFDAFSGLVFTEEGDNLYFIDHKERKYKVVQDVDSLGSGIVALDLRGQKLTEIPPQVFEHEILQILLLSNNDLKKIPKKIEKLEQLMVLDLGQNELENLPNTIKKLKNLQTLLLHENEFKEEDMKALFEQLIHLKRLVKLSFGPKRA